MTVIGSAYVNIRAITSQLEVDIRKAIEKINDTVTIRVTADVAAAQSQIEAVSAGDQTIHVEAATAAARAEFEHMRDDMDHRPPVRVPVSLDDKLARIRLALLTVPRRVQVAVDAKVGPLKPVLDYIGRLSGLRVATANVKELLHEFSNIDKAVPGIALMAIKFGAIAAAALAAAQGVLTLGDSLLSVVKSAVIAAPGIAAGFIVGITTLMIALKDFKNQLPDVANEWKLLGTEVKKDFWSVAREPIRDMANTLFPLLKKGLAETSTSLGGWASEFARSLKSALTADTLARMFGNLSTSIDIASRANGPFIQGMVTLGKVGSDLLPRLANWWVDIANKFNDMVSGLAADGSLDRYVNDGITVLKQLWKILVDVQAILSNVTAAAQIAGSDGLGTIVRNLDKIRDAVSSKEGFGALVTIFQGALSASSALGNGIFQIFGAIGTAAPAINSALESVGGIISKIAKAISDIISDPTFQAGFAKMFSGIEQGVNALLPVLGTTGPKIGALLSIIGDLAANIGGILGTALQVALPFITAFKQAIEPLVPILGDALIKVIQALAPTFQLLADVITQISPAVTVVVDVVSKLIVALVQGLGPALPGIVIAVAALAAGFGAFSAATAAVSAVTGFVKGIVGIGQLLIGLSKNFGIIKFAIEGVAGAFNLLKAAFLANPIGIVIGAITLLVTGFVLAYNNVGWFRDAVDAAMKWIGEAIGNVVKFWNENLVPMFQTATTAVGDFFGAIGAWVGDAIKNVGDFFNSFGKGTTDAVNGIGSFFSDIGKGIADAFNGVVSFVSGVFKTIGDIIWAGLSFYISIWVNIFNTIRDVFVNIWNGIVSFFQPIVNLIGTVISKGAEIIWTIWSSLWEIVSTVFYGIWINLVRFFTPIIQGIADTITSVVTNISNWWNSTWQAIVDFFTSVWNSAVAFFTPIIQGISDTITNIVTGISNWWNTTWQAIVDFFTSVWNGIVAFVTPIIQSISDTITTVVTNISNWWNSTWQGISDFFIGLWNGIVAFVTPIVQSIFDVITSVITSIQNTWNNVWSAIGSFVSTVWSNIVSGVSGFVGDVGRNISDFLGTIGRIGSDILQRISDFPSLLINAGRDLINGLTQGIANSANLVIEKIKEIASGALDAIKNFFGIKSPSRVMRDQVGKQIGAGLAIGIEQSVDRVSKAAAALADAAMPNISDITLPNIVTPSGTPIGSSSAPAVLSRNVVTGTDSSSGGTSVTGTGVFGNTSSGGPNVNFIVNPSAGLNEEQIGTAAMNEFYWKLSLGNV